MTIRVRCLPPVTYQGGSEDLHFEVDGVPKRLSLNIGGFTRRLVDGLPDKALDLLEIAALVYGIDASVSRGGPTDRGLGKMWRRSFEIEMPVRDYVLWSEPDLRKRLEEMLAFLSDDQFSFSFTEYRGGRNESAWFDFGPEEGWAADRVLMFSGGLDSLAGAVEEVAEHRHRVALVSHVSATKIARVQRDLYRSMQRKFGPDTVRHFPMKIQMMAGATQEGTHRTRSFLFAVLGMITAQSFGQHRVSFHENGLISLNLPPVGNVIGSRATRTTHPQSLTRFTDVLSAVFGPEVRVDNPFFWRTKTDVLSAIHRLGMSDQIRVSSSCADTHNRTRQHPHCGRCSQCIDRRFAVLAAGLQGEDPEDAYAVDLLTGVRERVQDREMALAYLRNALAFENISATDLEALFPEILRVIEHLQEPSDTALRMLAELLRRHGHAVARVMRDALQVRSPEQFPEGSLPRLFGDLSAAQVFGPQEPTNTKTDQEPEKLVMQIDEARGCVTIDDRVTFKRNATSALLLNLALKYLEAAGQGLDPLDYPFASAGKLAKEIGLAGGEALRRRINRARSQIRRQLEVAGLSSEAGAELIENSPWHGYRLNPDRVVVRRAKAE